MPWSVSEPRCNDDHDADYRQTKCGIVVWCLRTPDAADKNAKCTKAVPVVTEHPQFIAIYNHDVLTNERGRQMLLAAFIVSGKAILPN